jgi:hypothetical protein
MRGQVLSHSPSSDAVHGSFMARRLGPGQTSRPPMTNTFFPLRLAKCTSVVIGD